VSETSDAPPGEPPAYIIGDNGASAEGDLHGCFNELINSAAPTRCGPPIS
jgi:hypothetical protein